MERKITYKSLKSRRRFGLEIELSRSLPKFSIVKAIQDCSSCKVHAFSYGKSVNNKLWHVKSDQTCGDYEAGEETGWEIASFVGQGPQDIIHMGDVATALKEAGAKVNNNCGLHIHAEAPDLEPYDVGILLAYWIKIEPILKCIISPYRDFEYSWPLENVLKGIIGGNFRYAFYSPEKLYSYFLPIKYEDDEEEPNPWDFRYRAINIINYYMCLKDKRRKRKTIELRFPESTLEANDVIGWLRLYLNFIEYAKISPMPKNLYTCDLETALTYLGLHHDNNNFYLFGPSLNKTRIWFLNKIIKNLGHSSNTYHSILRRNARKMLKEIKI
jgi:hypothetical protein